MADYKTDTGDDPGFQSRVSDYRSQVEMYAACWEEISGEPVSERVLVFTAQGRSESW